MSILHVCVNKLNEAINTSQIFDSIWYYIDKKKHGYSTSTWPNRTHCILSRETLTETCKCKNVSVNISWHYEHGIHPTPPETQTHPHGMYHLPRIPIFGWLSEATLTNRHKSLGWTTWSSSIRSEDRDFLFLIWLICYGSDCDMHHCQQTNLPST